MLIRRKATYLAGALLAAATVIAPAITAGAAPAATAAPAAVPARAHASIPLVNTNEDIESANSLNNGDDINWIAGNVPYGDGSIDSTTDVSEVNCAWSGGKDWCYLKDSAGDCMNVPGSGQYAGFVVASSCPSNFTPEEWWRTGTGTAGYWKYQNRHFGEWMDITCAIACYNVDVTSTGNTWTLPDS